MIENPWNRASKEKVVGGNNRLLQMIWAAAQVTGERGKNPRKVSHYAVIAVLAPGEATEILPKAKVEANCWVPFPGDCSRKLKALP